MSCQIHAFAVLRLAMRLCFESASRSDIRMSVRRNIIPNYSQQNATFLDLVIFTDALHVSVASSAHHQERITVHTASGIVKQHCC